MLKYTGKGYIIGVPARTLTDEEANKYGKARLIASGLYIEDTPRKEYFKKSKRSEASDEVMEGNSDG